MSKMIDGLWIFFVLGLVFICTIPYMDLKFFLIAGLFVVMFVFGCIGAAYEAPKAKDERDNASPSPKDNNL